MKKLILLLCIPVGLLLGCISTVQSALGYTNEDIKLLRQTPEPGVVLDKDVAILLDSVRLWSETSREQPQDKERTAMEESALEQIARTKAVKYERVETLSIPVEGGEIDLFICDPRKSKDQSEPIPVMLFLHGGSFMSGDFPTYSRLIRRLALTTNSLVVAPMYRLAPQYPFPVPLEDSFVAYQWVLDHAEEYGGDLSTFTVSGDSAGGNLAMVLALLAANRGVEMPHGLILYYPVLDLRDVPYISREYYDGGLGGFFFLDRPYAERIRDAYLAGADDTNPYLSPLLADIPAGFPPVLQIVGQVDPLRDDVYYMDIKLRRLGVSVETHIFDSMPHGFMSLDSFLKKEANRGFAITEDFVEGLQ